MRLQVASDQLEVSEEVDARTIPGTVGDSLNHPFGVTDEIDSRIRVGGQTFPRGQSLSPTGSGIVRALPQPRAKSCRRHDPRVRSKKAILYLSRLIAYNLPNRDRGA
jgi:hypothetical protein